MGTIDELLDRYDAHGRFIALSPATIRRHRQTIERFSRHCDVLTATRDDVEVFVGQHSNAQTRSNYLGDIAAFFVWAVSRGHAERDPTEGMKRPKVTRHNPNPLTFTDVCAIRASCFNGQDRLAIDLGLYAGLRCAEIAAIRPEHLDHDRRLVSVRKGKGGKDRSVFMSTTLAATLNVNVTDVVMRANHPDSISERIRRVYRRAGVSGHVPHDLRATFATDLAHRSGGDLALVSKLLGHSSLETTRRYVKYLPDGADIVEQLHTPAA